MCPSRLTNAYARLSSERGQGGVEYLGVVIAAALLVIAIAAAASGFGGQIVDAIESQIQEIIDAG